MKILVDILMMVLVILQLITYCDNYANGDDDDDDDDDDGDIHLFVKHCSSEDKILPSAKCWLL